MWPTAYRIPELITSNQEVEGINQIRKTLLRYNTKHGELTVIHWVDEPLQGNQPQLFQAEETEQMSWPNP